MGQCLSRRTAMLDFIALAQACAPTVAPETMAALVRVESAGNPYAIGVVGGRLTRQPRTLEEAVATAYALHRRGYNFSLGIAQVNRFNLAAYQLSYTIAFDPCLNLRAGSKILEACYTRARNRRPSPLLAAFSCYYSGNFSRGFRPDRAGQPSYVQKVVDSAGRPVPPIPVVPALPARPVKGGPPPAEEPVQLQRAAPADIPPPVAAPPPAPRDEDEPPRDPTMVF